MAKPEWGSKRICQSCATKYYDLGRSPIVCPKCDTVFQPVTLLKSRRNRPPAAAKSQRPAPAKPDDTAAKAAKVENAENAAKAEDAKINANGAADDPQATETNPSDDDSRDPKVENTAELGPDEEKAAKAPVKAGEAEG